MPSLGSRAQDVRQQKAGQQRKCDMKKEMHSPSFLDLNDTHSAFVEEH